MKTLIVLCHPLDRSYVARLWRELAEAIGRHHDVTTLDLYRDDRADRPVGDALRGVDAVVLVYPTWWAGFPAPLQAWVEHHLDLGAWADVDRIIGVTTHGSGRTVNLLQGRPGRRLIRSALPWAASSGAQGTFIAMYGMDRAGDDARSAFRRRAVSRVLAVLAR